MTDEQRIKELAAKLAEAEQRIADIQQRVCVAVEQRDEAIRQRDRGDICRMACKARDELEAKLVEAENLLRTDSDGNIRSVFYMEGQAEKAERERDELKAELEEAEKQRDDAQAFFEGQADKTADLQESLHVVKAKLAEVARERDEALAKLANASMEWMFGHATRLRSALRATTEGCLPDDKMEAQPAKLLARAELAERERDELKGQLARAETRERDLEMVNARVEADYAELERERDELKAKLAEAEKRNDTLLSHNKALANGLQNDGLWSQDHEELIRATRERDELKAALDKTREALELAESRLAYCVVPGLAECARDELKAKLALRDSKCALSTCEKHGIHQPFGVGTKGCFSFCDEHAQAFRAEWVVKEKLADAEQRIAELEARDKLKAEEYDTRIVLAAQFERERDEARAKAVRAEGALASHIAWTQCHPGRGRLRL